jgi:hypothetical protein
MPPPPTSRDGRTCRVRIRSTLSLVSTVLVVLAGCSTDVDSGHRATVTGTLEILGAALGDQARPVSGTVTWAGRSTVVAKVGTDGRFVIEFSQVPT